MKTLLAILLLTIGTTATAQMPNDVAQGYVDKVTDNVQGYIDRYETHDGDVYAFIHVNEYMEFSLLRTMITMITDTHRNIQTVKSWTREDDIYQYGVLIGSDDIMFIGYLPSRDKVIITHFKAE